uniref:Helicase ATP-binding domain-containing protein n=1 Tax=Macrostomum lignano TaxID=282301 RepID=A0A1I8FDW9_9PLAT
LKAIPLGRCGLDLVVQSKAGTGKTCVFAIFANNHRQGEVVAGVRVLALSPTSRSGSAEPAGYRDHRAASGWTACACSSCHRAAGVKEAEAEAATDRVRMLVLDEADALLNESFQQDINCIYWKLPQNKQVLALSATYPDSMAQQLSMYMRRSNAAAANCLAFDSTGTPLPDSHLPNLVLERKARILGDLLAQVQFGQCLVFSNYQERARELCQRLEAAGWPGGLSGWPAAAVRANRGPTIGYDALRDFRCRVL